MMQCEHPKRTVVVPLLRRRGRRSSSVVGVRASSSSSNNCRGGGEFFEEEEKYETERDVGPSASSSSSSSSSSKKSSSPLSSSSNKSGSPKLDPELDLPHNSSKKTKPPAAKKKSNNNNSNKNNATKNTATRTVTTKDNVKIGNSSVPKKSANKSSAATTNANTNADGKEEREEALSEKEEEEVEDEDQAPKHETRALSKEQFEMQKKRLELLIEEKEWAVEEARDNSARSSVKLQRVLDYVNAVEAYKELCSSRVPDTVSDFLGNYVNVLCLPKHAKGYDEALSFLGIDFEDMDEDDLEITHEDFLRETEHYTRIEERYDSERKTSGSFEEEDEFYEDDEDEYYEDDDELLEALLGGDANYIAEMKLPLELHLAQDIDGNWRWLEDDLGRVLKRKPEGDFIFRLMSFEDLMNEGLNVNCLREEVDPNELIDFSKCRSFDDARRAMKEATEALRNMEADGWVVEKSFSATAASWGASSSGDSTDSVFDIKEEGSGRHLCMTKELRPLRTMSHVDGLHPDEDDTSEWEIHREEAAGAMARDAFDSFDENE